MAAHLRSLGFEPGARIGLLSKNTAHWLMTDFAIWMAGHVSVPLYPTLAAGTIRQVLEHSERGCCSSASSTAGRNAAGHPGRSARISLPLSPAIRLPDLGQRHRRDASRWPTARCATATTRDDHLHVGHDRHAEGRDAELRHVCMVDRRGAQAPRFDGHSRMLSYLPLAHVAERTLVEHGLLASGMHVLFADSSTTFAADLQRARPTVFFSVPRLWVKFQQGVLAKMPAAEARPAAGHPDRARMFEEGPQGARAWTMRGRGWRCGADAARAAALVRRLGLELVEVYGMTENCGVSHAPCPAASGRAPSACRTTAWRAASTRDGRDPGQEPRR